VDRNRGGGIRDIDRFQLLIVVWREVLRVRVLVAVEGSALDGSIVEDAARHGCRRARPACRLRGSDLESSRKGGAAGSSPRFQGPRERVGGGYLQVVSQSRIAIVDNVFLTRVGRLAVSGIGCSGGGLAAAARHVAERLANFVPRTCGGAATISGVPAASGGAEGDGGDCVGEASFGPPSSPAGAGEAGVGETGAAGEASTEACLSGSAMG